MVADRGQDDAFDIDLAATILGRQLVVTNDVASQQGKPVFARQILQQRFGWPAITAVATLPRRDQGNFRNRAGRNRSRRSRSFAEIDTGGIKFQVAHQIVQTRGDSRLGIF